MESLSILDAHLWIGIGVSALCGGILGLERQVRGKPTGMRTSILICLGAFVFVRLAAGLQGQALDPSRVVGQIATGVGFLGAGVILARGGALKGVTSAAVIWVLAGIGATIGLERYGAAIALAVSTLLILTGIEFAEKLLRKRFGKDHAVEEE
jgi:putative Mg2+ transporter-C (MgtC) family protein